MKFFEKCIIIYIQTVPAMFEWRTNYNRNYNKGLLVRARYVMPNLAFCDIKWKTEYCGRFTHLLRRVYNLRETALRGIFVFIKGFRFYRLPFIFIVGISLD